MPRRRLRTFTKALRRPAGHTYPFHDRDVRVAACGRICIYRKKINLSIVLAERCVGIKG